jgi:hypothetical protein
MTKPKNESYIMSTKRKSKPTPNWQALATNPKTPWHLYGHENLRIAAGALMGKQPHLANQLSQMAVQKYTQANVKRCEGLEPAAPA